jgi:hypothetical protein
MNEVGRPREFSYNNWCYSVSILLPWFFAAPTENELTFFTKLLQSGELAAISPLLMSK